MAKNNSKTSKNTKLVNKGKTSTANNTNLPPMQELVEDIRKIKWGEWKGKDGIWSRFGKVLIFSGALLGYFTLCNFLISLIWRAL